YITPKDASWTGKARGFRANDSDVDGDPLTAILVSGPAHGSVILNSDGSFTYTPALNYNGSDSFTYKANDGLADSAPATVNITVKIGRAPCRESGDVVDGDSYSKTRANAVQVHS